MTSPIRGTIAAALVATAPLLALAQTTAAVPAAKPAPYKSAFEGHRRFDDQKVQGWREANDNVGRIGGWRAYAREAAGEEAASPPANPASMPHDAHKGHGGHSMHKKP